MKLRDRIGISPENQRKISRTMQLILLLSAFAGLYLGNPGVIVNSLVGLAVTFLPGMLEKKHDMVMDPGLVLWITSAVFFHGIGTLGPYREVWWWDHLTHALSSSVVAAAGYASFRAFDEHRDDIHFPEKIFFVFILIFVVAFGVLWELLEFWIAGAAEVIGAKTILTQYGLEDTMKDLVFDIVGGSLVAVSGEFYLADITSQLKEKLA